MKKMKLLYTGKCLECGVTHEAHCEWDVNKQPIGKATHVCKCPSELRKDGKEGKQTIVTMILRKITRQ